jgi:hypothetical protein
MNWLRSPRQWLAVAAVAIVVQTLVLLILSPSLTRAAAVIVAALFASLLLRGSRCAWAVVLVGAGAQVIDSAASSGNYWNLAIGSIVSICLLAPASVQYIWTQRPSRRVWNLTIPLERVYASVKVAAYGVLARVAEWESDAFDTSSTSKPRSYRVLLWRLGVGCLALLMLVGITYNWQHGSGQGSPVVSVIADVAWVCYALVQLAFFLAVLVIVCRYFATPKIFHESSQSSHDK